MLKRRIRSYFSRLRSFMQAEILLDIRTLRDEIHLLAGTHDGLRATLYALRDEHQGLRATFERLHGEHEALRATLARLDLFDQTARTVEDGLLSLALLRNMEEPSETHGEDRYLSGT